jgi:hypothetical protein
MLCEGSTPFYISDCKVHEGFYYAFADIKNQIFEKVKTYQQLFPQKNIM